MERHFGSGFFGVRKWIAGQSKFAVEDEQVDHGFEIRVERVEVKLVSAELDIGGRRRKGDGDTSSIVPLVFQRKDSSAVRLGAGYIGNISGPKHDVVKSSRAGREGTRSSRWSAQLVKFTPWTVPLH